MTKPLHRLVDALRAGERVFVPAIAGESALLAEELQADPERARDVHFVGVQFPGIDTLDYLSVHPAARLSACFMSPAVRRGLIEGRAELLAEDYAGIAHHLQHGLAPDLAIAQVSPPDAQGRCSLGVSHDFMPLIWRRARRRIAHVNPSMPRIRGSFDIAWSDLDGYVDADRPLLDYADPAPGDVDCRIAVHAAALIRDGDTLQFGIGTVPRALGGALADRRGLRIHAGMVTQAVRQLQEAGALEPQAPVTTGVILGDAALRDHMARLPTLQMTDVTRTHSSAVLSGIERFVAVNSAVEVDLFGQVNSERANGGLLAGAGGLPAFAHGALSSPGGRLLICLRATASRGAVSRIVPVIDKHGLCTLPRHLADVVVTEHGVAELRGRSVDQRAAALLAIAAPEHRAALSAAWEQIRSRL